MSSADDLEKRLHEADITLEAFTSIIPCLDGQVKAIRFWPREHCITTQRDAWVQAHNDLKNGELHANIMNMFHEAQVLAIKKDAIAEQRSIIKACEGSIPSCTTI